MGYTSPTYWVLAAIVCTIMACCTEEPGPGSGVDGDLTQIDYDPQAFVIEYPEYTALVNDISVKVPEMDIPADNPMTQEGVELGRHLFYDKLLSADGTQSCASCHLPEGSFTDNLAVSKGIDGIAGTRSSMSLLNVGFNNNGLFWDGRVMTLEEQALLPVEDEIELHNTWPQVIDDLRKHDEYPAMFRKAFGISNSNEITKEMAAKAIAQFERSIYSFESKFDKFLQGQVLLTDDELEGFELFVDIQDVAHCIHCHTLPMFTSNDYFNNGLVAADDPSDFIDIGKGAVSNVITEYGFFRTPTLRNVELTAPYMRDGTLSTLEEVMDHYASGGQDSYNKDTNISTIELDDYQKEVIIAFMKTLTDTSILDTERLADPFK